MRAQYFIDGVEIKRPSGFSIERYPITNLVRIGNGDMHGDLLNKKRKFILTYDAIDSRACNQILSLLWDSNKIFFDFTYVEDNVRRQAPVYYGALPKNLHRTGRLWVWKNVTFNLIER